MAYNLIGWLEKNKDPLNDTVVDQFKKGTNQLAQDIFADHPGQSGGQDAGGKGEKLQFRQTSPDGITLMRADLIY